MVDGNSSRNNQTGGNNLASGIAKESGTWNQCELGLCKTRTYQNSRWTTWHMNVYDTFNIFYVSILIVVFVCCCPLSSRTQVSADELSLCRFAADGAIKILQGSSGTLAATPAVSRFVCGDVPLF